MRNKIYVGGTILTMITLPMIITKQLYKKTFGTRYNQGFDYYELIKERVVGITRKKSFFLSNRGQKLVGFFYYNSMQSKYKGVIIWVHGMRTSHESYLGEISYLVKNGYLVYAYDNTGVGKSEGDSLVGLTQAPIDLSFAISHIAKIEEIKELPLILIGHSWGGFAVSSVCCNTLDKKVSVIVSLAGYEKNSRVIKEHGKAVAGKWISLLMPYIGGYEKILFPKDTVIRGLTGIMNTDAEVLLVHCEDDAIVNYQENFLFYKEKLAGNERVHFMSFKTGGHRPSMCKESFDKLQNYKNQQTQFKYNSIEYHKIEEKKSRLILELNENTMGKICDFIQNHIN